MRISCFIKNFEKCEMNNYRPLKKKQTKKFLQKFASLNLGYAKGDFLHI